MREHWSETVIFSEETREKAGKKSKRASNWGARKLKVVLLIKGVQATVCWVGGECDCLKQPLGGTKDKWKADWMARKAQLMTWALSVTRSSDISSSGQRQRGEHQVSPRVGHYQVRAAERQGVRGPAGVGGRPGEEASHVSKMQLRRKESKAMRKSLKPGEKGKFWMRYSDGPEGLRAGRTGNRSRNVGLGEAKRGKEGPGQVEAKVTESTSNEARELSAVIYQRCWSCQRTKPPRKHHLLFVKDAVHISTVALSIYHVTIMPLNKWSLLSSSHPYPTVFSPLDRSSLKTGTYGNYILFLGSSTVGFNK